MTMLERWEEVAELFANIEEFIAWAEKNLPDFYFPGNTRPALMRYFGIDARRLDDERRALLDKARAA